MKARLLRAISPFGPDGASLPRLAGGRKAGLPLDLSEMRGTAGDVVADTIEGGDRTGAETGPLDTALAGAGFNEGFGQRQPFCKAKSAAIGVPQPVPGMDEQAQRRGREARLGPPGPGEKGPRRRPEGKEGEGAAIFGQRRDDPLRPAVERMGLTIGEFRRLGEARPKAAAFTPPIRTKVTGARPSARLGTRSSAMGWKAPRTCRPNRESRSESCESSVTVPEVIVPRSPVVCEKCRGFSLARVTLEQQERSVAAHASQERVRHG